MSTQLREMFDAAAESEVPNGMAERAVGAARQRRSQRYVVGGAVLATAAVVLGVVVAVSDVRMDAEPKPTDVASIPNRLPKADGLPVADYAEMTAASAAYVSQGELVLVDGSTGEPARAREGAADQPANANWFSSTPANDVFLSPDGRWADRRVSTSLIRRTNSRAPARSMWTPANGRSSKGMTLANEGVAWPQQMAVLAWAPDSPFHRLLRRDPESAPGLVERSVAADSETGSGSRRCCPVPERSRFRRERQLRRAVRGTRWPCGCWMVTSNLTPAGRHNAGAERGSTGRCHPGRRRGRRQIC